MYFIYVVLVKKCFLNHLVIAEFSFKYPDYKEENEKCGSPRISLLPRV